MLPALFLLQELLQAQQEGVTVCRLSVISPSTRMVWNCTPGKERGGVLHPHESKPHPAFWSASDSANGLC